MLNVLIKLFVSKLNGLFLLVALTGFVCTYKIQAEEECLSSNVLCYECDSRVDPNCADPFDFSFGATLEPPAVSRAQQHTTKPTDVNNNETTNTAFMVTTEAGNRQANQAQSSITTQQNSTIPQRQPKKLPAVATCRGCCVKITSQMHDGGVYVKRTCTTNLQINFFMVGLVCMKESGDRGKMCFCENDYCNDQPPNHLPEPKLIILLIALTLFFNIKLTN